jgi:hypothetical protein
MIDAEKTARGDWKKVERAMMSVTLEDQSGGERVISSKRWNVVMHGTGLGVVKC